MDVHWLWKYAIRACCLRGIFAEEDLVTGRFSAGKEVGFSLCAMRQIQVWDQKEYCVTFLYLFRIALAALKETIGILYID